jgi:hypothetical protein
VSRLVSNTPELLAHDSVVLDFVDSIVHPAPHQVKVEKDFKIHNLQQPMVPILYHGWHTFPIDQAFTGQELLDQLMPIKFLDQQRAQNFIEREHSALFVQGESLNAT